MKVKILKKNPSATIPFKKHATDFCYDVVATSCEEIAPNVYRYGTGLAFQIERDYEPLKGGDPSGWFAFQNSEIRLSIDGRARSSVWKTGMVLSNCEGTVDEGYTGEVFFVFYHVMQDMPKYEVGDRIAQIKIGATLPIDFEVGSELAETERGEDGYGSTGK